MKRKEKTTPYKTHLNGLFTNYFYTVMRVDWKLILEPCCINLQNGVCHVYLVPVYTNSVKDIPTVYALLIPFHFNEVLGYSVSYFSDVCLNQAYSVDSFGKHPWEKESTLSRGPQLQCLLVSEGQWCEKLILEKTRGGCRTLDNWVVHTLSNGIFIKKLKI